MEVKFLNRWKGEDLNYKYVQGKNTARHGGSGHGRNLLGDDTLYTDSSHNVPKSMLKVKILTLNNYKPQAMDDIRISIMIGLDMVA
jgi:hypothetical protein